MPDREVDYEYELSNGWGQYQNVVLRGLKEINERLVVVELKVDGVQSQQDKLAGGWFVVKLIAGAGMAVAMIIVSVLALLQ